MTNHVQKIGILISSFAAVTFGFYPTAAKLAYQDGANPTFMILMTTFFRGFGLYLYCLYTKKNIIPKKSEANLIIRGGFFQALSVFGIITSLQYIPGAVTITIIFTHTIMLLIYMSYLKELEFSKSVLITTIVALFGVSLVVDVWNNLSGLNFFGIGLAFMAAIATMSRLYVFGKQTKINDPAVVGARIFIVAFLFSLLLVFFNQPQLPNSLYGWTWAGICCLSLVLGTFAMFYGIALVGSFQFSIWAKLEPIFTACFSFIFMGEILNSYQYLGMLLIISSLIVYQTLNQKNNRLNRKLNKA